MHKMIGKTIVASDIPSEVIFEAKEEAQNIFDSPYTNKNSLAGTPRTFNDILQNTLVGKVGEYFLKTEFGYTNDPEPWHDLISPKGERTEVKTWKSEYITDYQIQKELSRIQKKKSSTRQWFFSTKLIIIEYNRTKNLLTIRSIHDI